MHEHFSGGKFRARTFHKRKLREQTFSKRKVSFVNIYCFELVCFVPEDVLYI